MKLSLSTDFTALARAVAVVPAADATGTAFARTVLAHDERHVRRRALPLDHGGRILVDLPDPVALEAGDRLLLEDGRQVEIAAADEELLLVRPRDAVHLAELAWHIGNRHLAARIEGDRILILRDHVIRDMLEGLGATVEDVIAPFAPLRGAYSGAGHNHGHGHHDHGHDHAHD
jgi:urease accessory protein